MLTTPIIATLSPDACKVAVERARTGEETVLTEDGKPVARVSSAAYPPGFNPPRASRPPGYVFGLENPVRLRGVPMAVTLKEQRR